METQVMRPIDEISRSLTVMADQFKMALPAQIAPEKFIRVVITAVQNSPDLLNANRQTLYSACMKCATDGLIPDGREAVLTTFGNEAVYLPMVGGILKKVRNSGELSSITSQIVHEKDSFRFWVDGDGEHLNHEPVNFGDRGEAVGVYALVKTKDGGVYIEVLDKAQVMAVKAMAKTKKIWEGPFGFEMWRKTAIRRLSKRLPMSTDLDQVLQRDDDIYDLTQAAAPEQSADAKTSRLEKIIDGAPKLAVPVAVSSGQVGSSPALVAISKSAPSSVAEKTPENKATGRVEGMIAEFRSKDCKNGSTRWAVRLGEQWFGTFSDTHAKKLAELNANNKPIQVLFSTRIDANKKYYDIEAVSEAVLAAAAVVGGEGDDTVI